MHWSIPIVVDDILFNPHLRWLNSNCSLVKLAFSCIFPGESTIFPWLNFDVFNQHFGAQKNRGLGRPAAPALFNPRFLEV